MAIRGARAYKKALLFSSHKWDGRTMAQKKSGETIDDVVEYVRRQMYLDKVKEKIASKDTSDDDSDDEDVLDNVVSTPPPSSPTENNSAGDGESEEKIEISKSEDNSEDNSEMDTYNDECNIPSDYLFPSFFVLRNTWSIRANGGSARYYDNQPKRQEER